MSPGSYRSSPFAQVRPGGADRLSLMHSLSCAASSVGTTSPDVLSEFELAVHAPWTCLNRFAHDAWGAHLRRMVVDTHRTQRKIDLTMAGNPSTAMPGAGGFLVGDDEMVLEPQVLVEGDVRDSSADEHPRRTGVNPLGTEGGEARLRSC